MKKYCFLLLTCSVLIVTDSLRAQGTAFTYQGRLNASGAPANGSFDLAFTLYATNVTGNAIAGPVTNTAVAVSNGLFATLVDFGNAYTGTSHWLDIAVSTNRADNFSTLAPRQQLTPVPYALTAANVSGVIPTSALPGFQGPGYNTVSGGSDNGIFFFSGDWNTLGGGSNNTASGNWNTVGGGAGNFINGDWNTVGGGSRNFAGGSWVTVAGGVGNTASGEMAIVGGGGFNTACGFFTTVAGGQFNTASGTFATIGGGISNTASGDYSFAAGYCAQAVKDGSFVWADDEGGTPFSSSVTNSFNVRANGGVQFVTSGAGMTVDGSVQAITFNGDGSSLNNLNASQVVNGVVPTYVLPGFQGPHFGTVGGGLGNTTSGNWGTVAGGEFNTTSSGHATVGGGLFNTASGPEATVAGGQNNTASGFWATVGGGVSNTASGYYSFAAGYSAQAINDGSFVWADDEGGTPFSSSVNNSFNVRANGGVQFVTSGAGMTVDGKLGIGTTTPSETLAIATVTIDTNATAKLSLSASGGRKWILESVSGYDTNSTGSGDFKIVDTTPGAGTRLTIDAGGNIYGILVNTSDVHAKENFAAVNPQTVLEKVAALPITEWNYKAGLARHLGPMAQDFHATFGLGNDDKGIATVDEGGVALAAIQGLNQKLDEKDAEIQALKQSVAELKQLVRSFTARK